MELLKRIANIFKSEQPEYLRIGVIDSQLEGGGLINNGHKYPFKAVIGEVERLGQYSKIEYLEVHGVTERELEGAIGYLVDSSLVNWISEPEERSSDETKHND